MRPKFLAVIELSVLLAVAASYYDAFSSSTYDSGIASIPKSLEFFFREALDSNINTMYLSEVSRVKFFEYLATLPIAKVILDDQKPLGIPQERSLVVLGIWGPLGMDTVSSAVSTATSSFTSLPPLANYLVLMEDQDLLVAERSIAIALGNMFADVGIIRWCVTGHRTASFMTYAVIFSNEPYGVHAVLNYTKAYGTNRIGRLEVITLKAIATMSFPYSYYSPAKELLGKDVYIFRHMVWPLKTRYFIRPIVEDADAQQVMRHIAYVLTHRKVDFLVTRKQTNQGLLPQLHLSENTYLCIVAPRITSIDLTGSLMRPFTWELWLLIGTMITFMWAGQMLCQINQSVQRMIYRVLRSKPAGSLISVALASFTFLLLECYLAKVTSFFLVYCFRADCETLEEFFAENIPIRLPEEQLKFLSSISPHVAQSIKDRAVDEASCEEFTSDCAHLDTLDRATFFINNRLTIDPVTGRKSSYIVQEPLEAIQQVHVYARGFPMIVQFHHALRRVHETGFVVSYDRFHQRIMHLGVRNVIGEDNSLRYDHLVSLWLFYGAGCLIASIMFFIELMTNAIAKRIAMRSTQRLK